MVAPFCGCLFGGWLYDVLIYTGPSPVNTPWFGLKYIIRPDQGCKARREAERKKREEGTV